MRKPYAASGRPEPASRARSASRTASSNEVSSIGTSSRIRSSPATVGVRSPSISGLATAAFTGVTRWSHHEDSLGVSTGTSTIGRRLPRNRAMRSIISRYVITSGPPTSNDSPFAASSPQTPDT